MAAPAPPRSRAHAFDRPLHQDPLLWGGLLLGVALVVLSPPTGTTWAGAVLLVAARVVVGVATAALFGGFVRNLVRALTDEDAPRQEDR